MLRSAHQSTRSITETNSLPPRGERILESALAGRAFFDGDDGAALVGVDERNVEQGTLFQKLEIAGAVGLDIRQPDEEEPVGDLHRQSRERRAARLLVGL